MLDNIFIILLRTKHPGNIGSAARAMHNMGLTRLRLAAPQCRVDEESARMARGGLPILERAQVCRSLSSALRGIRLVVGTTGKSGGNRARTASARALAPRILSHAARHPVGVLFGPEDTGLVDDDLLRCQMLLRIPTRPRAHSINLAQAVMLVAYELYLGHLEREPARVPDLAPLEQVEAMYRQFESALRAIGFLHEGNARHMMFRLRELLGRAGLEKADVGIVRGIARQIAWFGENRRREVP